MWAAIKAVTWSFFGIRSKQGYDEDRQKLTLKQIVIAGIVCVMGFILTLFFLVRFITAK